MSFDSPRSWHAGYHFVPSREGQTGRIKLQVWGTVEHRLLAQTVKVTLTHDEEHNLLHPSRTCGEYVDYHNGTENFKINFEPGIY